MNNFVSPLHIRANRRPLYMVLYVVFEKPMLVGYILVTVVAI